MKTETILVLLNKLKPSPGNVRKTGPEQGIEELAASIAAHGLLQPLVVTPEQDADGAETGYFLVEAGERRRRALCLLAKRRKIRKSDEITCTLRHNGSATEVSLAENFYQCPMHPADQFEAFQRLNVTEGLGAADIAARFGITPAVVRQRLKLAAVSPALMERYRAGEMNLDQLMAFTITDDHAAQERVCEELSWNKGPDMIRKLLTKSHVESRDRRAVFVGAKAYEAAGGIIVRDLFAEDHGGYFADSQLLNHLAIEKLKSAAEEVRKEGWKWVEAHLDFPQSYPFGMRRVFPEPVTLSEEETARRDALEAELEALSIEYEGEEPPEEARARFNALNEELEGFERRQGAFRPEDVARAGALVTLDPAGEPRIDRGLVRPEDEERDEVSGSEGSAEPVADPDAPGAVPTPAADDDGDGLKPLPDKVILDLSAHRTAALQECLASTPEIALIAVAHALAIRTFYGDRHDVDTCLRVKPEPVLLQTAAEGIGETKAASAMAQRHREWQRILPQAGADLWEWLLGKDSVTRASLLAYCAARSVSALREPWDKQPRRLSHADRLSQAVGLDMADWWRPTKDGYLLRVPKARILEAVRDGVSGKAADDISGMKKEAMAQQAEQLLESTRWLPEPLRTEPSALS